MRRPRCTRTRRRPRGRMHRRRERRISRMRVASTTARTDTCMPPTTRSRTRRIQRRRKRSQRRSAPTRNGTRGHEQVARKPDGRGHALKPDRIRERESPTTSTSCTGTATGTDGGAEGRDGRMLAARFVPAPTPTGRPACASAQIVTTWRGVLRPSSAAVESGGRGDARRHGLTADAGARVGGWTAKDGRGLGGRVSLAAAQGSRVEAGDGAAEQGRRVGS